ncbi:hypothetical protein ABEG70_01400 [Pantoea agglomerans]|uniref:hypothetical protein n=1 Tax=Enterobacter agglomerans TaxID=549 RepID=UPI00320A00E4
MDMVILEKFCTDVRFALEDACSKRVHNESSSLHHCTFPAGCCGDTCQILSYLIFKQFRSLTLKRSGVYKPHYIQDERLRDDNSHAWLEIDSFIIDLTADQFNDRGFSNPAVMITQDDSFHKLFAKRDERFNLNQPECPRVQSTLMATTTHVCGLLVSKGWGLGAVRIN